MEWFWDIWQNLPWHIDPVVFQIGGFKIQYYGLMYILAFALTYYMVKYRAKRETRFNVSIQQIQDLSVMIILGLIVGARLGYVLFYHPVYYIKHPLEIVLPFSFSQGITFTGISGMSYHGGAIGVAITSWLYIRKEGLNFWEMSDLYVPIIPLAYTFGRIGNFINGELYGRITTLPIGMYFPLASGSELRHPSQLYEAFFEGIFLFVVLAYLRKRQQPQGALLAFYLIGYGFVRFVIEFFRQPDDHLGFVLGTLSMGQVLCSIMVIGGLFMYTYLYRRK